MKTVTVFALTIFASSLLVFGQESDEENAVLQAERNRATEENAVLQIERDLATAYLNSEDGAIARYVMDDYMLTHSTGKITTRADDLDEARGKDPKYEVFENHDMKVRIHGDTAVVTGRRHMKGTARGKPFDSKFQFTDTFVKDTGRWRLLAGHVSKRGWGTRKSTGQNF
jgi:ketosteroid isomerase-like protein